MPRDVHDLYADNLAELVRVRAELEQARAWLSGKIQEIKRLKNSRENDLVLLEQLVGNWKEDANSRYNQINHPDLSEGFGRAAGQLQAYIESARAATKEQGS